MDINRVIEIDADSQRDGAFLSIRYAYHVDRERERQPSSDPDLEQDLHILTHTLALIILQMEQQGQAKPGEAISFAVSNLQAIYVDANIELRRESINIEKRSNSFGRTLDGF